MDFNSLMCYGLFLLIVGLCCLFFPEAVASAAWIIATGIIVGIIGCFWEILGS